MLGILVDGGIAVCANQTLELSPRTDPTTQTNPAPISITNKNCPLDVMATGKPLNTILIIFTEKGNGSKNDSGPLEENSKSNP